MSNDYKNFVANESYLKFYMTLSWRGLQGDKHCSLKDLFVNVVNTTLFGKLDLFTQLKKLIIKQFNLKQEND
jgi:hypothetical protein